MGSSSLRKGVGILTQETQEEIAKPSCAVGDGNFGSLHVEAVRNVKPKPNRK
jgi:hypothetical protein